MYIPNLNNFVNTIQKIDVQNNYKNRFLNDQENKNEIYLNKMFEYKCIYLDNFGKNITSQTSIWKNWDLNSSIINFKWDNKLNIFQLEFGFINSNDVNNIQLIINNEKNFIFKPKNEKNNDMYWTILNSLQLENINFDFSKIKTLQIVLQSKFGSKICNFVFNSFSCKTDFLIEKECSLILKFQNQISIRGEEVNNFYTSVKFSPFLINQGAWNKKFISVEYEEDLFYKIDISKNISISNIPISETKTANLESFLFNEKNKLVAMFDKNTYYDLVKKETVLGFNECSNPGYIVPFEFSGNFFPILNIKINGINYKISWQIYFDKPYFKKNEGKIKIKLDNSYNKNKNLEWYQISNNLLFEFKKIYSKFSELIQWLKRRFY